MGSTTLDPRISHFDCVTCPSLTCASMLIKHLLAARGTNGRERKVPVITPAGKRWVFEYMEPECTILKWYGQAISQ